MKYFFLHLIALAFFSSSVLAQNCSTFYPFQEGVVSEVTTYDKKGRIATTVKYKVMDVDAGTATIHSEIKDKKGELLTETQYELMCDSDGIEIDFKSMYNSQMLMQFENMETEIEGTNIVLPNNLNVGDALPDASMTIKISMSGININTQVTMTDRNVIGKETITTPAGTFECFVVTHLSRVNSGMGMNIETSSKQWIAKGVGMVQQEDYNNRGKLTGRSELTTFQK